MTVYAETNLILELVYEQEQAAEVERLLAWAEAGRYALVLPAMALPEAYLASDRRSAEMAAFAEELTARLAQLGRTARYVTAVEQADQLVRELLGYRIAHQHRLHLTLERLVAGAGLLPFSVASVRLAGQLTARSALRAPDAAVLAAVLLDRQAACRATDAAAAESALLVTRDEALANVARQHLRGLDCAVLRSYRDAVQRLRSL